VIRSVSIILLLPLLAGCDRPETTPPISAPQTSPLNGLFVLQDTKTARVSSWDRSGGNNDFVAIAPGETKALADISGAGVIRRFFVSMIASDRMRLRKLVLRMYWDGEKSPGFSLLDFDGMVSYLPMPFAKGARIPDASRRRGAARQSGTPACAVAPRPAYSRGGRQAEELAIWEHDHSKHHRRR
jgi:hypothetical protein